MAAEALYNSLNVQDRNILISFSAPRAESQQNYFPFKPNINAKSKQIMQKSKNIVDLASRTRVDQIMSRLKIEQQKRLKIGKELSQCTFQPNNKKSNRGHTKSFYICS